jgi:hypothetical protein
MKMKSVMQRRRIEQAFGKQSKWLLAVVLVASGGGCQREEIKVYTVTKEPEKPMVAQSHNHGSGMGMGIPKARPQVSWTLPAGWKEGGAGQMSVASFSIKGEGEAEAQVTITPLAKLAGRDAEIVNMWREQVGLKPLERDEALKQFEKVDVGGESANLFHIQGLTSEGIFASQIITAIVHREDASWFYKLSGDAALVTAQKPVFIEFLKSIRLKEAPATAAPADVSDDSGAKPNWTVPSQWKVMTAGQMQVARFAVPERNGAKAEVGVSVFPNDTGGTLANVNRWRRQIGLAEVNEGELSSVVSPLDPAIPGAILVEMVNDSKKLLGAVVPRNGSYWFYKLMGDTPAVSPEKEAFVAFAKSKP